jgi:hypothetical protein
MILYLDGLAISVRYIAGDHRPISPVQIDEPSGDELYIDGASVVDSDEWLGADTDLTPVEYAEKQKGLLYELAKMEMEHA